MHGRLIVAVSEEGARRDLNVRVQIFECQPPNRRNPGGGRFAPEDLGVTHVRRRHIIDVDLLGHSALCPVRTTPRIRNLDHVALEDRRLDVEHAALWLDVRLDLE
jgi:hypothetical protein